MRDAKKCIAVEGMDMDSCCVVTADRLDRAVNSGRVIFVDLKEYQGAAAWNLFSSLASRKKQTERDCAKVDDKPSIKDYWLNCKSNCTKTFLAVAAIGAEAKGSWKYDIELVSACLNLS